MEEKESFNENVICTACLCVDRRIQNISDVNVKQFYLSTLSEIPLYHTVKIDMKICWECNALLKKIISFKEQIKDCYRILLTYTNEDLSECLLTDVTRPPRLTKYHCSVIDIPSEYDIEVVAEKCEENIKEESNELERIDVKFEESNVGYAEEIKVEKDTSDTENCPYRSDYSEDLVNLESEIQAFIGKRENKRRGKEKVKNREKKTRKVLKSLRKKQPTTKNKKTEVNNKIRTIELSYEEMLEERSKESVKESYLNADFKCEYCLIGFSYEKTYKEHLTSKHAPDLGEYSCPICKTVIATVDSFTAHYKRHLRRYECTVCSKRTMDRKAMLRHYSSVHEAVTKKYKCNLCDKISITIDAHLYHKDLHKNRVQCGECDKTFSHRSGLINHRITAHKMNKGFPCIVCEKVFRWKTSLKKHMEKHEKKNNPSEEVPYCQPCGVTFSSICSYQRHMKNSLKHVTENELKFICADCNRKFSNKTKLRDHIEEKHLLKTYQCSICLKPSKNRVCLDQHIRNVHKGRPKDKICHHCGKGFPTKVQLDSHIRSHTGEKPYICEYCPTTFSQQSNLYKHNRQVHMNIKAKRYPLCRKRKGATDIQTAEPLQIVFQPKSMPPLHYISERDYIIP